MILYVFHVILYQLLVYQHQHLGKLEKKLEGFSLSITKARRQRMLKLCAPHPSQHAYMRTHTQTQSINNPTGNVSIEKKLTIPTCAETRSITSQTSITIKPLMAPWDAVSLSRHLGPETNKRPLKIWRNTSLHTPRPFQTTQCQSKVATGEAAVSEIFAWFGKVAGPLIIGRIWGQNHMISYEICAHIDRKTIWIHMDSRTIWAQSHINSYGISTHMCPKRFEIIWNLSPYGPKTLWFHMEAGHIWTRSHMISYGLWGHIGVKTTWVHMGSGPLLAESDLNIYMEPERILDQTMWIHMESEPTWGSNHMNSCAIWTHMGPKPYDFTRSLRPHETNTM